MPLYEHPDWGDIQAHTYMQGVITSVDATNDLAGVTVPGGQDGTNIPLFYHCSNEAEERANGAIEGAAAAFAEDDEVIVMCTVAGVPVRIVGFVDGIKPCSGYAIIESGDYYCFVWDFAANALATDVYINNTNQETFATWPFLWYQPSHPDGPDLLSEWKATLGTWDGWEELYTTQESDPAVQYTTDNPECYVLREGYRTTPFGEAQFYYRRDSDADGCAGPWTTYDHIRYAGTRFTANNGSGVTFDIYKHFTETYDGALYVGPGGAETEKNATFFDTAGLVPGVSIDTESFRLTVGCDCYYNTASNIILQLIPIIEDHLNPALNKYLGSFATADVHVENDVDPTTLTQNSELSTALEDLIQPTEDITPEVYLFVRFLI